MPRFTPKYANCPYCGGKFDNRGYANHVDACRRAANSNKKAARKTNDSVR